MLESHAGQPRGLARARLVAGEDRHPIDRLLHSIRSHLGMDVALVSEFVFDEVVLRHVDGGAERGLVPGARFPADGSYCRRIAEGLIPQLIPDTAKVAEVVNLDVTRSIPIGAHIAVPIRLRDGRIYGSFCCFSHDADATLNERDLQMLKAFAVLAADEIQGSLDSAAAHQGRIARIGDAIEREQFQMVYQPIVDLASGQVAGVECLARFPDGDAQPPSAWFEDARAAGLGVELELAALRAGLSSLAYLPAPLYLSANISPAALLSPALRDMLIPVPAGRVVLEVSGRGAIDNHARLRAAIAALRRRVRIAIDNRDDVTVDLREIVDLEPNIIKLGAGLIRHLDMNGARVALATAMVGFARALGCGIVATGIETEQELDVVRRIGFGGAQGFHIARPMPIAAICHYLRTRDGAATALTGSSAPSAASARRTARAVRSR